MTSVLGLPLEKAAGILEGEGFEVKTVQISSKTGPSGEEERVLRQRFMENGTVELVFARFHTHITE